MIEKINESQRIYNFYGREAQINKLLEETLELGLAIKRYQLNAFNKKYTYNFIEEIADVLNVIDTIALSEPNLLEQINNIRTYKVKRQIRRIEKLCILDKIDINSLLK